MVLSSSYGSAATRPEQTGASYHGTIPGAQACWASLNLPKCKLFGTDGIRGQVGDILTAELATQVGYWAGQTLQATDDKNCVIIGQDSRNSGPMLAHAIALGLTAAGIEVWDLGLCPTPAVAHLTSCTEAIGGVMISASHNPPGDNGIKFFGATGTKLSKAVQQQIETALRQGFPSPGVYPTAQWHRYHQRPELVQQYITALKQPLSAEGDLSGLKIVLDLAWGAAVDTAPAVFKSLGAEVLCLHDQPDGDRINVNCGSTHLEPLQAAVRNHQADMGFAFDGDADRVMAVDGSGRVVDGDYILYLWGQALRQRQQLADNTIVATVMANLGFERAWQQQGGTLIRTAVGDQHVHAKMVERGATLGGEQSGHILCPHYGVSGDGTLTALHLANLVKQSGNSLSKLVDQSFQTYPQVLKNVRVVDSDRRQNWQSDDRLQQAIAQAQSSMGDAGRVLIRASGTEPVIRVMVEAATDELVNYWCDRLVTVVEEYAIA
ncbi:MAG: phosphoglucosamine mutase [Cyanothece sp. SIO2G6]|nr:phosphoglucosamine mutase [Cyanothece sp. SIO2G6]